MIGLDIGVNQGFSQCEDGSVCDIGQDKQGTEVEVRDFWRSACLFLFLLNSKVEG